MKRRTKAQQYADIADAVTCINKGEKVKRSTYKDGSIPTKSVVPVDPKPEKEVVKECLTWLREHRCLADRHDAASFQNDRGQWGVYGIKSSGDIHGAFPHSGIRFELECKHGSGGRLSPGQQKRQKDMKRVNAVYWIIHGLVELIYYWNRYEKTGVIYDESY